jgi:hypothetical protein
VKLSFAFLRRFYTRRFYRGFRIYPQILYTDVATIIAVMPDSLNARQMIEKASGSDSATLAANRPLRRKYKTDLPSVQKKRNAQQLAELRLQEDVLKQSDDLVLKDKQRQFGMIYSKRKRLREKQKILELEEECDRIRASNRRLKIDNTSLQAIFSVTMAQVSQMDQAQLAVPVLASQPPPYAQAHVRQHFATLPMFQPHQPLEPPAVTLESAHFQQPLSTLGSIGSSLATLVSQSHHFTGPDAKPLASTFPLVDVAIAHQAQSDWQWEQLHRAWPQQMIDQQPAYNQLGPQLAAYPQYQTTNVTDSFVSTSHHESPNMPLAAHPWAWNQCPNPTPIQPLAMSGSYQHAAAPAAPFSYPNSDMHFSMYQQQRLQNPLSHSQLDGVSSIKGNAENVF